MIKTFKDTATEQIFHGGKPKSLPADIHRTAYRKLVQIYASSSLQDLHIPPGNRLEALKGDLGGLYSIRINAQWRICFSWHDGHAYDVHISDYH
ncbi:MAG: type II toxin-antitoxin system RelE/ParE family toxin [Pseudomonadota bacterium]